MTSRGGRLSAATLLAVVACKGGDQARASDGAPAETASTAAPPSVPPASASSATPATAPSASASPGAADAPPDDKHLGFMSDGECEDARTMLAGPETNQLEMNEHANAKATTAACAMKPVFLALRRSLAPNAATALDATQVAWRAFSAAREGERFPHAAEPGYYGSIVGLCYGALGEEAATNRTAELRTMTRTCREAALAAPPLTRAAKAADAQLNDVYGKIRAGYVSDPTFLKALTHAQVAWLEFRDAQVALGRARAEDNEACAADELTRVTRIRVEQLRAWLKPATDGDACAGSYGMPGH